MSLSALWLLPWITFIALIVMLTLEKADQLHPSAGLALKATASAASVAFLLLLIDKIELFTGLLLLAAAFASLGDLMLALKGRQRWFSLGILCFCFTHFAYVAVFSAYTTPTSTSGWITLIVVILAILALRWIWVYSQGIFRHFIVVYAFILSAMLITAACASLTVQTPWLAIGAALFVFSDLLAARNHFIESQWQNRALGLPLHYAGQYFIYFGATKMIAALPPQI